MRDFGYSEKNQKVNITDLQLWRRIAQCSLPFRWPLVAAIFLSLFITICTIALPRLLQLAIDHSITATALPLAERLSLLARDSGIYAVLILIAFMLNFGQILLLQWVGQSIMHNLRQLLFKSLLGLDLTFFSSNRTGTLVTRLTNDINNMNEMFTSVIVTMFNDLLRLAGILVMLYMMNAKLAGIMTIFFPVALGMTLFFSRLAREAFRRIRSQLAKLNSFLSESLAGMDIIQIFGQENRSRNTFANLTAEFLRRTLTQIKLFSIFMPLTELLSSVTIAVIPWYGGGEVLKSHLTLGELVAFITYMRLFFQPLRELAQKYSIVQSAMASAERIFDLLDAKSVIQDGALIPQTDTGEVEFKDVHFAYNKQENVLRGIDLRIPAGQTVAIVGATGSGKSTMVNLLLRFYEPDSGQIFLDGMDISKIELNHLRHSVGVILQDVFILQDTLYANIVLDTNVSKREVEQILEDTGLGRFLSRLPQGLETKIGDGGQELSTGEKQLLAFARVLCRKPSLLVLDEATAAIDTESENMLETLLETSFKGKSSLIIAHRLATIRRADHIVVMEHGVIVEQGTHEALLAAGGVYAKLFEMDFRGAER